jgi:hypothetical protein
MSMTMVRAWALTVCLAVAACGGDGNDEAFGGAVKGRPETVEELVRELYGAIGRNDPDTACALFTERGEYALLDQTGESTCADVIYVMAMEAEDPDAYADPTVTLDAPDASEYDEWCSQGITVDVGDDPPPGAFSYAEQPEGGWAVVGFNTSECPA